MIKIILKTTIMKNCKIEKNSSYNTISNYVDALLDSYLIFKVNRYEIKGKKFLKTQEKYYAVDIGLRYY